MKRARRAAVMLAILAGALAIRAGTSGRGIAAGAVAGAQTLRDPRPFKTRIDLTSVNVTVVDADGGLVTGLDRDAFEILDDGERQTITQFTSERVPVGLGVLLDISDSMFGRRIREARAAVERFLFDLLAPTDQYFLVVFNHTPRVLSRWTTDRGQVGDALESLKPSGGTAIYDALVEGLGLIESRERARGAIVIISDGADTASTVTLRDIRSALLRSDAFVYAVAIDSPERQPINTRVNPTTLREITDQSGGRTEVVHDTAEIDAATARIAEELNRQYLIGYSPAHGRDGRYHSIRVRVKKEGCRVRARKGYVAKP